MGSSGGQATWSIAFGCAVFIAAALISCGLQLLLKPLLQRHALAHPNARSSHKIPTPQGGGIGVVVATLVAVAGSSFLLDEPSLTGHSLWLVLAATVFIAIVGAVDDAHTIEVLPRLLLQAIAVAIVLAAMPGDLRLVRPLPFWLERAVLALAILWFVNLTNFMDGIDWMTVAEVVPVTAGLFAIGSFAALSVAEIIVALALCGAVVGFAPFNRPVAKLFLGDVGSLPIGILLAWLLATLAAHGHMTAAILLPLCYVADATITLFRRIARGEPVWHAHRTHFYQRATDRGFPVIAIVARVFAVNIALAMLAAMSLYWDSAAAHIGALAGGIVLVGWLLLSFERGRSPAPDRQRQ